MNERARTTRTRNTPARSRALLAIRWGLSTCCALGGLVLACSSPAVAAPSAPLISTATSESGVGPVGVGTVLTVTFDTTPALTSSYSLTLTDGANVATLSSPAGLTAAVVGDSVAFTVHSATSLSRSALEVLGATGVSDGSGNAWNLIASGEVDKATATCTAVPAHTRVFGGSNCSIGFGAAGPTTPDVYDVIPLPTQDLPGPPNDSAPEVITACGVGSTDAVYDVGTGAPLGANACGNNPPGETSIGNTNSNTLDYIPTPSIVAYEQIGVVETLPGSRYVSATAVPPQLTAITVSGNQATFFYYEPVVCQANNADAPTISQFAYVSPSTKTTLAPGDLVYPTAIACPPSGGATSVTLTYPGTIPVSASVRFKYDGYGDGHFIVGAPGTSLAGEREASESAYVGPGTTVGPSPTVTSFTPPATTLPTSAGGAVHAAFATTNALGCTIGATSQPSGATALTLPSVASCNGMGTITVPANASTTSSAVYTVTLTANGALGTTAATAPITITVPPAPPPAPVNVTPPTISGTPTQGQTLTESHGSWLNAPTSYTYQWERCSALVTAPCNAIGTGATSPTYVLTSADVGSTIRVIETAHDGAPNGTSATSTATATVRTPPTPTARIVTTQVNSTGRSATFTFTATGTSTGFQCSLVVRGRRGSTPSPSYSACSSPKGYANLKSGTYVFSLRAIGPGGTGAPVTYSFTIR